MADIQIHLPAKLDPERAGSNLSKMLRRKIAEGITRKVGRNINGLRQLNVTPLNAGLDFNWNLKRVKIKPLDAGLDFDWNLKRVKIKPLDAGLDFNWNLRRIGSTSVNANLNFGDLNLNVELDFNR